MFNYCECLLCMFNFYVNYFLWLIIYMLLYNY